MTQHRADRVRLLRRLGLGIALGIGLGAAIHYLRRSLPRAAQGPDPDSSSPSQPLPASARGQGQPQILIPVANPATAPGLIQLASALGGGEPGAELIALKIVTVPRHVSLEEARRYALGMRENYDGALAHAASYALEQGVALRTELQVARKADAGILAYASQLPGLELILLGWRGSVSLRRVRRSINQEIVSRARTNVAVLRERQPGPLRRILVPVGWGPHARYGLRLAERLARHAAAQVTALRVLPVAGEPDWEGERASLLKLLAEEAPGLRYDTDLRLVRERAVLTAILAEAQREPYDLLIVGASDRWWVQSWLFGAIPDLLAEQAPCPVLLVRSYLPPGAH